MEPFLPDSNLPGRQTDPRKFMREERPHRVNNPKELTKQMYSVVRDLVNLDALSRDKASEYIRKGHILMPLLFTRFAHRPESVKFLLRPYHKPERKITGKIKALEPIPEESHLSDAPQRPKPCKLIRVMRPTITHPDKAIGSLTNRLRSLLIGKTHPKSIGGNQLPWEEALTRIKTGNEHDFFIRNLLNYESTLTQLQRQANDHYRNNVAKVLKNHPRKWITKSMLSNIETLYSADVETVVVYARTGIVF